MVTATPALLPLATDGCCGPGGAPALDEPGAHDLARRLKALADPTRLRLLSIIAAHDGGEACVCDLTEPVGLSQPTVSHHLKQLVDAGLVTRDKRGVWAYYALPAGCAGRRHGRARGGGPGALTPERPTRAPQAPVTIHVSRRARSPVVTARASMNTPANAAQSQASPAQPSGAQARTARANGT